MFDKYQGGNAASPIDPSTYRFSVRCPVCRHNGTFEKVNPQVCDAAFTPASHGYALLFGQRRCPSPQCQAHVFFVKDLRLPSGKVTMYPPEILDFDATDIPDEVARALEEAISCHAIRAYVASAIMVRKSIELLCIAQGINGGNLKDKIAALGKKITVSADLITGIDNLRLLGNDAAHISADAFNDVGEDEVTAAIELAKELLRATYQHKSIVERLAKLKK